MRNMARLGVGVVVAMTMLWLMAASALAANKGYEWCNEARECYGVVTIAKKEKTWSYKIGETVEITGTIAKKKKSKVFEFDYINAESEACEVQMKSEKVEIGGRKHKVYVGARYCEGIEVETAEWKKL